MFHLALAVVLLLVPSVVVADVTGKGCSVSGSYAFLPLGFLAFARFFVSDLAEGLGSAKHRHIRHNILINI